MSDELIKLIDSKLDDLKQDMIEVKSDLSEVRKDVMEVKIIQARHDENLQEHMHRTSLLEESQEVLYEEVSNIKLHKAQMDGVLKFLGIASTIVSVVLGLFKLFHKI